jgi:outer membrane receptor protein involved in Fe transport
MRAVLFLGTASAAACAVRAPVFAQTDDTVETVVVTGSRLPQQGLYSARPLTAIGQQELKFEGTTDVTTLLDNLPEVFGAQNSAVSNGATGAANIDLRGLGAKRTLVAVNGTRLMPGDPSDPVADLNDIPAALVDHIEVLSGGASTVHGSDALAGVVNFVLRKDFEGVEIDATSSVEQAGNANAVQRARIAAAGYTEAPENVWDGTTEDATLILGSNTDNGRGNVTAYLGYRSEQPIIARDFADCPLATTFVPFDPKNPLQTGLVCGGSSTYDRWISADDEARGASDDFFETGNGAPGSGRFVPFTGTPSQRYNYAPFNYLRRPDARYIGGFFAHFAANKAIDAYSSLMFSDDDTVAQIAPSGLFRGEGEIGGSVEINCSNPLMTSQERLLLCGANGSGASNLIPGQALVQIGRRAIEASDRLDDLRHSALRMQTGARGDLGSGWSYDIYGQLGLTLYNENLQNDFSIARVQNALEVNPATGACYAAEPNAQGIVVDPACVPLDIFNGFGSITPAMAKYVYADGFEEGFTQEQIVSGSPVEGSFGAEWRSESLKLKTSSEFADGDLYSEGGPVPPVPLSGYDVAEGFGELNVPLVQDLPGAQALSANAGFRYASYNTAGTVTSYKYGIEWQPVGDVRFRGLYERAVRAPNILELFTTETLGAFIAQDPCATSTAGRCASVANAGTSRLDCPDMVCETEGGGNLLLKPERGNTRTIGAVLTPAFIDGFTATVDYFNIDVAGFVGTIDPNITLAGCDSANATAASEGFFCPLVHRNAQGQIFGGGYVNAQTTNTGFLSTTGLDLEANYVSSLDSWGISGAGTHTINLVATWLDTLTTEPVPGQGTYDCAGLYGVVCGEPAPRWRHKLRVTWATPWTVALSLAWRHFGAVDLDANTANALLNSVCGGPCCDSPDGRISSFDYFDLALDWPLRVGVDLRAGVNNIFGIEPPIVDSVVLGVAGGSPFSNINTYPGTYDSLGRTIFVAVTLKN